MAGPGLLGSRLTCPLEGLCPAVTWHPVPCFPTLCLPCREFAYVAQDQLAQMLKCHVFRCDTPAKNIATSLHEICSKVSPPSPPPLFLGDLWPLGLSLPSPPEYPMQLLERGAQEAASLWGQAPPSDLLHPPPQS